MIEGVGYEVNQPKVLVTGMSGLIGGIVYKKLRGCYQLSGLNRRPIEGVKCHQSDISDFNAIRPAFSGVDVVVHLAAVTREDPSWQEVLTQNIIGTYNVFEASRQSEVKRIIYASSGAAVGNWELEMPYQALVKGCYEGITDWQKLTHESSIRPNGLYGCSKAWGEALARYFSDTYDLSIICLRIGRVNSEDRPTNASEFSRWCSQRDIAQIIEKCIGAPKDLKFDIFYALSENKWSYRDIEHAREVVGYEPQDRAEDYRSS